MQNNSNYINIADCPAGLPRRAVLYPPAASPYSLPTIYIQTGTFVLPSCDHSVSFLFSSLQKDCSNPAETLEESAGLYIDCSLIPRRSYPPCCYLFLAGIAVVSCAGWEKLRIFAETK